MCLLLGYGFNTVKPLLSGHLRDLLKCPLNRGCKNCAMLVNDLYSMVTLYMIKFYVVKVRKLCCTLRKAFKVNFDRG